MNRTLHFILLIISFLSLATTTMAQDVVTIGSGTSTNSSLPSDIYYKYSLTEQLYTLSEIGGPCTISDIEFYLTGSYSRTRTWDIYLVNTDKTSFASSSDWIAMTAADLYYSGTKTMSPGQWTKVTLDQPFAYDGEGCLCVVVHDKTGSWESNTSFRCFTPSVSNQALYYRNDNTNPNPLNPTVTGTRVESAKSQIRLTASFDSATCPKPTALMPTNVGTTDISVGWTAGDAETTWDLAYKPANEYIYTEVNNLSTPSYSLANLTPNTAYDIKVRAVCSSDDQSPWTPSIRVSTDPVYFHIATLAELQQLRDAVNSGQAFTWDGINVDVNARNAFFILDADIDLGNTPWTPIGTSSSQPFRGHLNGAGHTISGLYIYNTSASNQGLFGYINGGSVSNLAVQGAITVGQYAGGICGYMTDGSLEHCVNMVNVSSYETYVGGICGYATKTSSGTSTIEGCVNMAPIFSYYASVGGICGYASSTTLTHCYNVGRVTSNYTTNIGPISSGASGTVTDNYYDCQMLMMTDNGIGTAKLISQMVGTALQGSLGADYEWAFTAGLYPRPASMTNNEWVNLYASACMLYATSATEYETPRSVGTSFALGGEIVGTTWTSSNTDIVSIDGYDAVMGSARGSFTLTASLNDKQRTFSMTRTSSAANPIMINTVDDLTALRTGINSGSSFTFGGGSVSAGGNNEYFALGNDLDLNNTSIVIGNSSHPFKGTFDGHGHYIKGLKVNNTQYGGLFGYVQNGTVRNLVVEGTVNGQSYLGGVCGYLNNGTLSNCVSLVTVTGTSDAVGGVCGYQSGGFIEYCVNRGIVSSTYSDGNVAGVCGYQDNGTLRYCYNAGKVSSEATSMTNVGPVVGRKGYYATVTSCYYDCQMSLIANSATNVSSKLTSQMVGTTLKTGETGDGFTAEHWTFTTGLYPRPLGVANTDKMKAVASACLLSYTNDTDYETSVTVATNFTLGGQEVGTTWYSTNDSIISIVDYDAVMGTKRGLVTLRATVGDESWSVEFMRGSSANNPYMIRTAQDLATFRNGINSGNSFSLDGGVVTALGRGEYFALANDIALQDEWTPIGTSARPFAGYFSGMGHTISGLSITGTTADYMALFGYASGTITNLVVEGSVSGRSYVAGICAYLNGRSATITDCVNKVAVSSNSYDVGGVCAYLNGGVISGCINLGTLRGNASKTGGICGESNYNTASPVIEYCVNMGDIDMESGYIGGICGYSSGSVRYCYNAAAVRSSSQSNVGPVTGSGSTSYCYYDRQMSSSESSSGAKLTSEMLGNALKSSETGLGWTSQQWTFAEGLYPRPLNLADSDIAKAMATPCLLAALSTTDYETSTLVSSDFDLGGASLNASWTSSNTDLITVSGYHATVGQQRGRTVMTVTVGSASKDVVLRHLSSASNPFVIHSFSDLANLRDGINGGSEFYYHGELVSKAGRNEYFLLDNDLSADSLTGPTLGSWEPIGLNSSLPFRGNINGDGHIINDLYIYSSNDYQGLFGYIDCGSISNLAVGGYIRGSESVGGICGYIRDGVITHCLNLAQVESTGYYVGGICGYVSQNGRTPLVDYCVNMGAVYSNNQYAGGICGSASNTTISYCYNAASVRSKYGYYTGPIVGTASGANITGCPYDAKMLCGTNLSGKGQATTTDDMLGGALQSLLGTTTEWSFNAGIYPRLAVMASNDFARCAATPVWLADGENAYQVISDFSVGTAGGVTWTSSNPTVVSLNDDGEATVTGNGITVLTASKNGIAYKKVDIRVPLACVITTAGQLAYLRNKINTGSSFNWPDENGTYVVNAFGKDERFVLANDIDLSSVCSSTLGNWTPIGKSDSYPFKGTFDGAGHTVSNLYNAGSSSYIGLFGYVDTGILKNLTVTGNVSGKSDVAGLCGYLKDGTITHCLNLVSVSATSEYVGGICGYANTSGALTTIEYCINAGTVTSTNSSIAGICSYLHSDVQLSYCLDMGQVSTSYSNTSYIGPITASSNHTTPECYYDNQMCTCNNGSGAGVSMATSNLLGDGLRMGEHGEGWTDDHFNFAESLYPQLAVMDTNDAAIVAAAPMTLAENETVLRVMTDLSVSTADNVVWTSSDSDVLSILDGNATLLGTGEVSLTASLNGVPFKTVNVKLPIVCHIATVSQLVYFRNKINTGSNFNWPDENGSYVVTALGKNEVFVLDADLDLSMVCGPSDGNWTPIGSSSSYSFKGYFDGNGHTISGLYISDSGSSTNYKGLFGYLNDGSVSNLTVMGSVLGYQYVGGIVGYMRGNSRIANCVNLASVSSSYYYVGGICGYCDQVSSSITHCVNMGNVTSTKSYVGGIVGSDYGPIEYCYNIGSVSSTTSSAYVGGIVGYITKDNVRHNYNLGRVTAAGVSTSATCGAIIGRSNVSGTCYSAETDYYDGKMCVSGNTLGQELFTDEMLGNAMHDLLGTADEWTFAEGLYPRLSFMADSDEAKLSVSPLLLTDDDVVNYVHFDFSVSTANNVVWSSSDPSVVSINGSQGTINGLGTVTLTATLDNISKTISLTTAHKHRITTVAQLVALQQGVNGRTAFAWTNDEGMFTIPAYAKGEYFYLANDLDLSTVCGPTLNNGLKVRWTPIEEFMGHFDGNGHTISNLYIDFDDEAYDLRNYQGLFNRIMDGAVLENLTIEGRVVGNYYVGPFCARCRRAVIRNCVNKAEVIVESAYGGGICSWVESSTITRCVNMAALSGENYGDQIGGIAGYVDNGSSISECLNVGEMSTRYDSQSMLGGIAGCVYGNVSYCVNAAKVSDKSGHYIGGLVGFLDRTSHLTHSLSVGQVSTLWSNYEEVGAVSGTELEYGPALYEGTVFDNQIISITSVTCQGLGTRELTGTALRSGATGPGWTDEHWTFTEGLYPRIKVLENLPASLLAASPVLLATGERSTNVESDFSLSVANEVTWTASVDEINWSSTVNGMVSIDAQGNATLGADPGTFYVRATLDDMHKDFMLHKHSEYHITSAQDFYNLSEALYEAVDGEFDVELGGVSYHFTQFAQGDTFILDTDIDLTPEEFVSHRSIGHGNNAFRGNFDGRNHIVNTCTYLFAMVTGGGCISNVIVTGNFNTGCAVCRYLSDGTISHCVNLATIRIPSGAYNNNGAGICSVVSEQGIVEYCVNYGRILQYVEEGSHNTNYGGIVRENYGIVRYCYTAAPIFSFTGGDEKNAPVVRFAWDQGQVVDCYYDSQWAEASDDYATGCLTSNMVGSALRTGEIGEGWTDEQWLFTPGLYPRLATMANVDAVIAGASPVYLDNGEDFIHVNSDFTVTVSNGVTWNCTLNDYVLDVSDIANGNVSVQYEGQAVMENRLNGRVYKTISLFTESESGPSGGVSHPILINNLADLQQMQHAVNVDHYPTSGKYYLLTNDIDMSSICGEDVGSWEGIGNDEGCSFKGHFDGNGHTISNIYVESEPLCDICYISVALFDGAHNGWGFCNIEVTFDDGREPFYMEAPPSGERSKFAIFEAHNGETCHVHATNFGEDDYYTICYADLTMILNGEELEEDEWCEYFDFEVECRACPSTYHGLFGVNRGYIGNLTIEGEVNNSAYAGGVCGYNLGGTIENCHNKATVTVTDHLGGGIAGCSFDGRILNSSNEGDVNCLLEGDNDNYKANIGGIVGMFEGSYKDIIYPSNLANCRNYGTISTRPGDEFNFYAGGIAGCAKFVGMGDIHLVSNCYNVGTVNGNIFVGGIVGSLCQEEVIEGDYVHIENCYNVGAINGTDYVAGIAGAIETCLEAHMFSSGRIHHCYNAGAVYGSTSADAIVSSIFRFEYNNVPCGSVDNCCFDMNHSGIDSYYGTGIGSAFFNTGQLPGVLTNGAWKATNGLYPRLIDNDHAAVILLNHYTSSSNGWYLVASPMLDNVVPTANLGLVSTTLNNVGDLYGFNPLSLNTEWRNIKADLQNFRIEHTKGYLMSSSEDKFVVMPGDFDQRNSVTITDLPDDTFNLVGNPFDEEAYLNCPYYRINPQNRSELIEVTDYQTVPVNVCESVFVFSTTVTFSKASQQ